MPARQARNGFIRHLPSRSVLVARCNLLRVATKRGRCRVRAELCSKESPLSCSTRLHSNEHNRKQPLFFLPAHPPQKEQLEVECGCLHFGRQHRNGLGHGYSTSCDLTAMRMRLCEQGGLRPLRRAEVALRAHRESAVCLLCGEVPEPVRKARQARPLSPPRASWPSGLFKSIDPVSDALSIRPRARPIRRDFVARCAGTPRSLRREGKRTWLEVPARQARNGFIK